MAADLRKLKQLDLDLEENDASDIEPHVAEKRYLWNSFADNIVHAARLRKQKSGIKRHPGHFQLQNCGQYNQGEKPLSHGYKGRHYEVNVNVNLHRTSEQLTRIVIAREVELEQSRRIATVRETSKLAQDVLRPLNEEFKKCIFENEVREVNQSAAVCFQSEDNKDKVLNEMMQKRFDLERQETLAAERKRQLDLLTFLSKDDAELDKLDDKEFVCDMRDINQRLALVQIDLVTAARYLEEEQLQEEEEKLRVARDVKDICNYELSSAMQIVRSKTQEECERQRQIDDLMNDTLTKDMKKLYAMVFKELAQEELLNLFVGIKEDTTQIPIFFSPEKKQIPTKCAHKEFKRVDVSERAIKKARRTRKTEGVNQRKDPTRKKECVQHQPVEISVCNILKDDVVVNKF